MIRWLVAVTGTASSVSFDSSSLGIFVNCLTFVVALKVANFVPFRCISSPVLVL